ncbi:uncharacterized protein LOC132738534 [Ruditapes philippinarum]|uniref:uncharacterized protein LOC132738534 n=1 Tax=Ruditapes philippinarum TaxID=129788 RepID=UPI00295A5E34|nr:uncharacterized protein LOC132738534 [Ruditapes philippinarum]
MVNSFEDTSSWFKAGLVFIILALILDATGFSLPYFLEEWVNNSERWNSGLWQTCTRNGWRDVECTDSIFTDTGWFLGAKILHCVGISTTILTLIVSLILLIALTNSRLTNINVTICFTALSAVGTGTLICIKMLLITPENTDFLHRYLGMSFYLCISATASLLLAWIFLMIDQRKSNS